MPRYLSLAKQAGKLIIKYGPQAKIVWDKAGPRVKAEAARRTERMRAARAAWQQAETTPEGAVLRHVHDSEPYWIVYEGSEPIIALPKRDGVGLADIVAHADARKRMTPAQRHERALAARLKRSVAPRRRKRQG